MFDRAAGSTLTHNAAQASGSEYQAHKWRTTNFCVHGCCHHTMLTNSLNMSMHVPPCCTQPIMPSPPPYLQEQTAPQHPKCFLYLV